jgi:serine/threonine-protein kinase
VLPRAVDEEATILAIDLRDLGWTGHEQWQRLLEEYPYGVQRRNQAARQVYELTDCDMPYLRADWFVRHAARPPLYHDLLKLPKSAAELEKSLEVDVRRNFEADRLWRAGFRKSGVSAQNRMVERHDAKHGAYWDSYDFAKNDGRADLLQFPLGPRFPGGQNLGAFDHDGGEIIFHLPNGLQAYLLAKADGTRIEEGPQTIVNDPNQFSGTFSIVNGISCMGCHKHGMIAFEDTVRATFAGVDNATADKVRRIYPAKEEMQRLVQADMERFLTAVDKATGNLVRTGPDDRRKITEFPEPVTKAAKDYDRLLSIEDVARELGLPESPEKAQKLSIPHAAELAGIFKTAAFRRLGLSPLASGETLAREVWEKALQAAVLELKLGVPIEF